ncbi:MAG: sugar phosphate isomerase/epimerase family protein [Bacteroidota bacterium]
MKNRSNNETLNRRSFLRRGALAAGALTTGALAGSQRAEATPAEIAKSYRQPGDEPTTFVHACATLAYRNYPMEEALKGIRDAGYNAVMWGTTHVEANGERTPALDVNASTQEAADLAGRSRELGLEPVKMFSTILPDDEDAVSGLQSRIRQASAAGIRQILTFGPVRGGDPDRWVEVMNEIAPMAQEHDVLIMLKQHGGVTTGSGRSIRDILEIIDHPNIVMTYDAGNVHWYLDINPLRDIESCADWIHGFTLKDARYYPEKTTCGPGFGEIDHYRLMAPVAFKSREIILGYENIYPAYVGSPNAPVEEINAWARLSQVFMKNVIAAIQQEA